MPLPVRGAAAFFAAVALSFALVRPFASALETTPPGAPANVLAQAGAASATLSWTAPDDGGSPITSYTVTPYIGSVAQAPTTVSGSPPWPTATVTGLRNGTTYSFTVTATNAVGSGPPSAAAPSSGATQTRSVSAAATPSASSEGQWGSLLSWPMVAVHSVLLDDGKVLQFDGWQQPEPTQVWDPSSGTFTNQTAPDSVFCTGMAQLPDGRVIVVGGYGLLSTGQLGIVDTNIFDPSTEHWTRVADMHYPRWYPSLTELADGRYVTISGIKTQTTTTTTWADTPEVYDPSSNTWTALSSISTSQVHEQEYPFSYLIPNGNVFTIAPSVDKSFELNVNTPSWTQLGGSSGVLNGSSVMYRPGQILYSGGATDAVADNIPAQANTAVINLNASNPQWQATPPMANARIYHTLTMLADGTVLAVGGEPNSGNVNGQTEVSGGVLPSEIWDPNTQTWSPAASTGTTRGYHSTAILMPDGTVLVAGSGHSGPGKPPTSGYTAQIYSPPYLFKGARPTLSSAPHAAGYGSTIGVSTPNAASITAVNLVSLGTDTHQSDMQQHFVPLSFTQGAGGLNVQMPSSAAVAPPSNYMLFIVNSNGVPSVASFINLSGSAPAPTAPGPPSGISAVAGDGAATVSWTAPNDGGDTINSYTITPYIGPTAQTPTVVTGTPPVTSATVGGLSDGTTYTFTVTATNAVGSGLESASSNAVTPMPASGTTSTSTSSSTSTSPTPGSGSAGSSSSAPGPRAPAFQAGFFTLSTPQVTSGHALVFKLHAPSAGTFSGTATTTLPATTGQGATRRRTARYGTGSASAVRAGLVRLVLSPTSAARTALLHGARLTVKVSVTFRSRHGSSLTRTIQVSVIGTQRRATGCIARAGSNDAHSAACRSLAQTSAITARARARFAAEALQKILPANLFFCVHDRAQPLPLSGNWTSLWLKTRAASTGRPHP
jgi:hypothetical protein